MTGTLATLHPRSAAPFDPGLPPAERRARLLAGLPPALHPVLAGGSTERRPRFAEDGFDGMAERWMPPGDLETRHGDLARRALEELNRTVLAPAPANRLLGRILALLSHYPGKTATPEVEEMIALDWAEDLGEFPVWAIDAAARSWRRTRKWRPSIAEMRALCLDLTAPERDLAHRLEAIAGAASRAAPETEPRRVGAAAAGALRRV